MTKDTNMSTEVKLDQDAADLLDPVEVTPQQVKEVLVVYVPRKDFEARINQDVLYFQKGVPKKVTRDMAAMLLEDEDRGYIKD